MEQGKPLIFGANQNKGIKLDGFKPVVVELGDGVSAEDLWIHDEKRLCKSTNTHPACSTIQESRTFSPPFGVFYETERACYMKMLWLLQDRRTGPGNLDKLLRGNEVWEIQ